MRTIHKYKLGIIDGVQNLPMPKGATIVMVDVQWSQLCLWAEMESSNTPEERKFVVLGTGHPLPDNSVYVGSVLTHNDALVWHVYEIV